MTSPTDSPSPLAGLRVLSLAGNLPGPAAVARLRSLGAAVIAVAAPGTDALAATAPAWRASLEAGVDVRRMDLKQPDARAALDALLADADLLVTSSRPASLARLGLGWPALHARFPRLCVVAIVGQAGAAASLGGHDLTYQATAGLLRPPALPTSLVADLAGAERAVSAALALLLARERGLGAGRTEVALADAALPFADPLRFGLTAPDGPLGGGSPLYALYPAQEGWVALAALEAHFADRLGTALGLAALTRETLAAAFTARSADAWEAWAAERDLPIVAVRDVAR